MSLSGDKEAPAPREDTFSYSPPAPAPRLALSPPAFNPMQAGVGNAAVAAAPSGALRLNSSNASEFQSGFGNAAVSHDTDSQNSQSVDETPTDFLPTAGVAPSKEDRKSVGANGNSRPAMTKPAPTAASVVGIADTATKNAGSKSSNQKVGTIIFAKSAQTSRDAENKSDASDIRTKETPTVGKATDSSKATRLKAEEETLKSKSTDTAGEVSAITPGMDVDAGKVRSTGKPAGDPVSKGPKSAAVQSKENTQETKPPSAGGAVAAVKDGAKAGAAAPKPAAPKMDTTSAESMLSSLAEAPPSVASAAFTLASTAVPSVQAKEKAELEGSFPQVSRPTGLPTFAEKADPKSTKLEKGESPDLDEEKGREGKPPEVTHDEPSGPSPGKELSTAVTQPTQGKAEDDLSWWEKIFQQVKLFTASLPTRDPGVSTSAGERPNVDLTGEANPDQNAKSHKVSNEDVKAKQATANSATHETFGENDIYPEVPEETLSSSYKPSAPVAGPGAAGNEATGLSGQELAMFDQSTGPWYAGKVGEQQEKYRLEQEGYLTNSEMTRADGERQIAEETEKTRTDQEAMQGKAKGDVEAERERWRKENEKIKSDYSTQSESKKKEVDKSVTEKTASAEKEADQKLTEAETKADSAKKKAEADAAEEKRKEEQKPRSWWQKVKGAISSVLNAIKKVVNAIFDGLRALVKGIFELAKKLVRGIIELARMAIVGLIKAFGMVLKGLVTIALAAFPEAAKKARAWIDDRVDQAVSAVNKAAELLKQATDAILDFVASTLDSLLGLVQAIYSGILTVLSMIISGELVELIRRIGYLISAAKTVPDQFETAALEELLGGNLDEPLSPGELAQAGITPPGAAVETAGPQGAPDSSQTPQKPWGEHNIGIDEVEHDMELSPELAGDLFEQTQGDGELELASSQDESRSMESVMSEVSSAGKEEEAGAAGETKYPDDGLNPTKRAEIKWQMMKDGISKWWSDNWPKVILGAAAALLGFIALNIVTGGAITAALPAILGIVGPLFAGLTILKLAGNVKDYVSLGWEGQICPAGKSLAKGLAAGAIELISYLTFKAGGAALKGAKALASGGVKLAKTGVTVAKAGLKAIGRGAKFIIEKGKVLFRGIAKTGLGKLVSRAKEFGKKLLERLRFKKIRITISGRRFKLEGFINPWVLLADGTVDWKEVQGRYKVGDVTKLAGSKEKAIVIGKRGKLSSGAPDPTPSAFVEDLKALGPNAAKAKFDELKALGKTARKEMISGMSATAQHARDLRKSMVAGGKVLKKGEAAHHIVPSTHARAAEARKILEDAGVSFNSRWNGAALSEKLHAPLHTNRYIDEVTDILRGAKSKQAIIARLKKIEDLIKAGNFPPT